MANVQGVKRLRLWPILLAALGVLPGAAVAENPETGPDLPPSAIPRPLSPEAAAGLTGRLPDGLWLMDEDVVLDLFHCGEAICGRIAWMRKPRDRFGQPDRDNQNPDPAMRPRLLCNQTIIEGLAKSGPASWENGRVYDPRSGDTYDVQAELQPDGSIRARIYKGITLLGQTHKLVRVARGHTDGWC